MRHNSLVPHRGSEKISLILILSRAAILVRFALSRIRQNVLVLVERFRVEHQSAVHQPVQHASDGYCATAPKPLGGNATLCVGHADLRFSAEEPQSMKLHCLE